MTKLNAGYPYPYFNDRRCGKERRKYSYTVHIPERRKEMDRRSGKDRRSNLERRRTSLQIVNKPETEDRLTAFH